MYSVLGGVKESKNNLRTTDAHLRLQLLDNATDVYKKKQEILSLFPIASNK